METVFIDSHSFANKGSWYCDSQFALETGVPYLISDVCPVGTPGETADTVFDLKENGKYRVWVRTKNWLPDYNPGLISFNIDGIKLPNMIGNYPILNWYWQIAGDIDLNKGEHTVTAIDETGWYSRFSSVIITNDMNFVPEKNKDAFLKQRAKLLNVDLSPSDMGHFDLIVAGAGPAGIPTAIAAARKGLKVAVIHNLPFIGGNASHKSNIGFDGAACTHDNAHETGIVMEIKQLHYKNGYNWQSALEDILKDEPNVRLFTNNVLYDAETENNKIKKIYTFDPFTGLHYLFSATLFADCTGDGWLGYFAGAEYRVGREAKLEFNENFADNFSDTMTMSGCLSGPNFGFHAVKEDKEIPFNAPEWSYKLPVNLNRNIQSYTGGEWWLEAPCTFDDLWEQEFVRDNMIRINVGYFDWLKNKYQKKDETKYYHLMKVMLFNSKREARRLVGDYILTQNDLDGTNKFSDTVAYTGWRIDVHNNLGIFSGEKGAFEHNASIPISAIPYRCLYSKNISNLFMAGRNISVSHIALGTTRVEGACAVEGEAVGVAAYLCKKYSINPRGVLKHIDELQQTLLADDVTIPWIDNKYLFDKAKGKKYTSENATESNGIFVSDTADGMSIILSFDKTEFSEIRFNTVIDLTLPRYAYYEYFSDPDMIKTCEVYVWNNDEWKCVGRIENNLKRQIRIKFDKVISDKIKISVSDTYGGQNPKIEKIFIM